MSLSLETASTCSRCGLDHAPGDHSGLPGGGTPGSGLTPLPPQSGGDLGLTYNDLNAWRTLVGLQTKYNLVARTKHAFGILVQANNAVQIPWSAGRIASLFIPSQPVWMGGDGGVTPYVGAEAGLPVATNATVVFGPEEGNSATWLISTIANVDVRCFELLQ